MPKTGPAVFAVSHACIHMLTALRRAKRCIRTRRFAVRRPRDDPAVATNRRHTQSAHTCVFQLQSMLASKNKSISWGPRNRQIPRRCQPQHPLATEPALASTGRSIHRPSVGLSIRRPPSQPWHLPVSASVGHLGAASLSICRPTRHAVISKMCIVLDGRDTLHPSLPAGW